MTLNVLVWTAVTLLALYYVIRLTIEAAIFRVIRRAPSELLTEKIAQLLHDILMAEVFVEAGAHSGEVRLCRRLCAIISAGISMERDGPKLETE